MWIKTFLTILIMVTNHLNANQNNMDNVKGYKNNNQSTLIGIVENQSWVTSRVLKENELKNIIEKYPHFTIIKYDSLYGILIEYNHLDNKVLEDIELLKREPGIYRIFNRVYEGKNAFELYTPQ